MSTLHHMGVKQLYVSKSMETFWTRAEARAKRRGVSFAEYVGRLIRADIMSGEEASTDMLAQQAKEAIDALARQAQPAEVDE